MSKRYFQVNFDKTLSEESSSDTDSKKVQKPKKGKKPIVNNW